MMAATKIVTSSTESGVAVFFLVLGLVYLAGLVVTIVAWVKILSKAGYSGAWVLVGIVPLLNIVMFLVFAFSTWPIQHQLAAARGQGPGGPGPWTPQPAGGYIPPAPAGGYIPPAPAGGYIPPAPAGGYIPPAPAGGYIPPAPGHYPPSQPPPTPLPPYGGGTV